MNLMKSFQHYIYDKLKRLLFSENFKVEENAFDDIAIFKRQS